MMFEVQNALLRAQLKHAEAEKGTKEHAEAEEEILCAEKDWETLCAELDKKKGGWEGK